MPLSFIKSSGNIITEDFCLSLANETKADYVKDKSFGNGVKKVDELIASTFEKLRERWEEHRTDILNDRLENTELRNKWILPLLKSLSYDPVFVASNIKSESGIDYHIPYKGWDSIYASVVHMVPSSQDLDSKDTNSRTHKAKSPQDCLQQYLNTSHHQWAILTNGRKIRLLRDFYHSITKGFLEFDLEGIFEKADTEQFRVLFRILHQSRIQDQYQGEQEVEYDDEGNPKEVEDACLLERFHKKSRETGVKVGNKLRDQVIEAIEMLGNGFAENLDPDSFQTVKGFYSEILNVIYRLLFLMFAEQKGWLPVRNSIYARTYSVNALREMAEKGNYSHDEEKDLWEGLKTTFRLVAKGYRFKNGDEINAFGGQLFSDRKIAGIKGLTLKNKFLLDAIYRLSYFKLDNLSNRINYANLAIDELGSVYESLLDYEPKLAKEALELVVSESGKGNKKTKRVKLINKGEFYLDPRGTDRKTTGSYYTDSRLVAQVIDSALVPVIQQALEGKDTQGEKEAALLELKVADIACGSGAFICAALEKLGEQLAIIRMGDEERPTEDQLREAKRDVLLHCIYGVDLNPMALELAKFSLWITASLPDMPLTFLDHKLKCGNSLIGATPALIEKGIPEEAYFTIGKDDKETAKWLRDKVKQELAEIKKGGFQGSLNMKITLVDTEEDVMEYLRNVNSQQTPEEVELAEQEYYEVQEHLQESIDWQLADAWTAAFFIVKSDLAKNYPTNETLFNIRQGLHVDEELLEEIEVIRKKHQFFHYHLSFPEVFKKGGFDCLLGNPPWEKINLEDKEFFAIRKPSISAIKKASTRNKAIAALAEEEPELYIEYLDAVDFTNKQIAFFKSSGAYSYGNDGLLNTYPLFTEKVSSILNPLGTCGYIIPSGFFMDDTTSPLFRYYFKGNMLKAIYDFENRKRIFQHVHGQYRFSIVTLQKQKEKSYKAKFLTYLHNVEDVIGSENAIYLRFDELKLFNPNNQLLPAFKNQYEVDLSRKLYRLGVLKDDSEVGNTVHIHRMINMTADSGLLHEVSERGMLPVYESKLFHQFDHRYASFEGVSSEEKQDGNARQVNSSEKRSIDCFVEPRFYSPSSVMFEKNEKWIWEHKWYLAYRYISSSTNERCSIASIIPKSIVSNSAYLIFIDNLDDLLLHLANMNTFWFDFTVRSKVTLNFPPVILEQCPCIKAEQIKINILKEIKERVLKLSYTATDLSEFGETFGLNEPFQWDEKERFRLQCELDAIYAHIYGLEKEEIDYILETFPIIKRKDKEKYDSYCTKETILQLYDEFLWVSEAMHETKPLTV